MRVTLTEAESRTEAPGPWDGMTVGGCTAGVRFPFYRQEEGVLSLQTPGRKDGQPERCTPPHAELTASGSPLARPNPGLYEAP